jgi:hypothetical protein
MRQQAAERPQQRALAGAVGPEQRHELAVADSQSSVAHRSDAGADGQIVDGQHCIHG